MIGPIRLKGVPLRLFKEFWLSAILACTWTFYVRYSSSIEHRSAKDLISAFSASFFLVSWATGQFFRVKKQESMDKNLSSIEERIKSLISTLELHIEDFRGHATGGDSVAYFTPRIHLKHERVELDLENMSTYPVFDVQAQLIDIDEKIDPSNGKLWTRHPFATQSIYPKKLLLGAYRIDLHGRDRCNLNIFIQTRTQGLSQLFRIARVNGHFVIAIKTQVGEKVIETNIPPDFPGLDAANPGAIFE